MLDQPLNFSGFQVVTEDDGAELTVPFICEGASPGEELIGDAVQAPIFDFSQCPDVFPRHLIFFHRFLSLPLIHKMTVF
jgi:hypothetical protein